MFNSFLQILKDERGISTTAEMMILIGITAVVATSVGKGTQNTLETGSDNVGKLLDNQFKEAGVTP